MKSPPVTAIKIFRGNSGVDLGQPKRQSWIDLEQKNSLSLEDGRLKKGRKGEFIELVVAVGDINQLRRE